jgi:AcrR family transcriptional regulator
VAIGGADATRERILDAAFGEFAANGVAGARVDRIAAAADCNKSLIYVYFESKENLFTVVLSRTLATIYGDLPFPTRDIPEFAGRIFDFVMANPQFVRLLAWSTLNEKTRYPPGRLENHARNVAKIAEAQADGVVTDDYPPEFVLTAVLALVTCWSPALPFGLSIEPNPRVTTAEIRQSVVRAVAAMLDDRV